MILALLVLFAFLSAVRAESAAALSDQALALAEQHRVAEAEDLWRRALGIDPNYFPALFNLGYLRFTSGNAGEARTWLERAVRANPADFRARYLLGTVFTGLGEREAGLREWSVALSLQPANLKLMQVMIVEYEKGLYYEEAEKLARRALEQNAHDLNLYLLAIHACQNARDLPTGLRIARRAAEQFPDSARANFEYGFHLQRDGRTADASRYLKRSMQLDPSYEEPYFFYGDQLVSESRDEEGIAYLRHAISIRADYVAPRISLARALMHQEKWSEAISELDEAVRIDARHPEPHLMLSRIYFRNGDEAGAAREKEIAFRLRRENPHILEAPQPRPFPK
jgi:tetratricopeptide (TPR) repeat protein